MAIDDLCLWAFSKTVWKIFTCAKTIPIIDLYFDGVDITYWRLPIFMSSIDLSSCGWAAMISDWNINCKSILTSRIGINAMAGIAE